MEEAKIGDRVTFKPGPKAKGEVTAKIVEKNGSFLVTLDDDGMTRRVRAGSVRLA